MKKLKLCAVALLGVGAFGINTLQAQLTALPFQTNDVQSLNATLTGVFQATNYTKTSASSTNTIAKVKTGKVASKDLLGLIGLAYAGDKTAYTGKGYNLQISLRNLDTNDDYQEWYVQVYNGTNLVLDTYTATPVVPANSSSADAYFDIWSDQGPINASVNEGKSGSATQTRSAGFEFYYEYYNTNSSSWTEPVYIWGDGTLVQQFSGNDKGVKGSYSIKNISGEFDTYSNNVSTVEAVITGGQFSGQGKFIRNN